MEYNRAQLKRMAKALVHDTRPKVWVVTLVYMLLTTVVVWVVNMLSPNPFLRVATAVEAAPEYFAANPGMVWGMLSGGAMVVCLFVSVLSSLYRVVMEYGYVGYCLKVWRRQDTAYGDVFGAFPMAGKVIGAAIMVGIYCLLWEMLAALGYAVLAGLAMFLMTEVAESLGGLVLCAAVVLLVIAVLCIAYRYSLTPYFLMSDPEMGIFKAITASKVAMRGNIRKRLVLDLSFLGWILLVMLIVFVAAVVGVLAAGVIFYTGVEFGMDPAMATGAVGVSYTLAFLLAFVASLPLNLWVTGYMGVTEAGFFAILTGEAPELTGPVNPPPPIPPAPPTELGPREDEGSGV